MTMQHLIKINSTIQTIKASHQSTIKLESGSTLHIRPHHRHTAKEVYRADKGRFAARLAYLF